MQALNVLLEAAGFRPAVHHFAGRNMPLLPPFRHTAKPRRAVVLPGNFRRRICPPKKCPPLSARFYRMGAESRPGFQKYPFPCFPRPFRRRGRFPCGRRPGVLSCPPGSGEGRGTGCGSPFRQASSGNHAEIPAVSLPCRLSSLLRPGQSAPEVPPCSFRHRGQR